VPRLKCTYREFLEIIDRQGFVLHRQDGGSHRRYRGVVGDSIRFVDVSYHALGDEVPVGTLGGEQVLGIGEDGQSRRLREHLAQQFHTFPGHLSGHSAHTRDVSARMREAPYQAGGNEVARRCNNWDFTSCRSRGLCCRCLMCNDQGNVHADKLRCKIAEASLAHRP